MATKQLGMDLVSEDGKKYHVRIEQEGDSPDIWFRIFKDDGPLMHIDGFPVSDLLSSVDSRRLFQGRTNILFTVEAFGILKSWARMIWDMTR
jgi:hypothetical protein